MSAFVVDKDIMHRCVRALCSKSRYGQVIRTFAGIATDQEGAATEIGRRLFTLNIEAVTQRYPDCEDKPANLPGDDGCATYPLDYRYAGRSSPLDRADWVACYKALQCLHYQCSEGDVPKTELYHELQLAIGEVAGEIVEKLPEYAKAAWG